MDPGESFPPAAGSFAAARPVFPNPDASNADIALSALPPGAQGRQDPAAAAEAPEDLLLRPENVIRDAAPRTAAAASVAAPMAAMPPPPTSFARAQAPSFDAGHAGPEERSSARFAGSAGPAFFGLEMKGGGPGFGDPEGGAPVTLVASAGELDLRGFFRYFPFLFTAFCIGTWIVPIWVMYHVGQDVNVTHWVTDLLQYTPWLLAVYAVAHIMHAMTGGPARLPMIVCTVGSCVVLLLLANWILIESQRLGNVFAADDCSSFEGKHRLEDQWQQARSYYSDCVDKLSVNQDIAFEAAVSKYRITDCPNYYADVADAHPDWVYLGQLEELYHCSGWCSEEKALWTLKPTKDACSAAVAQTMGTKIRWGMMQVMFYNITVLCVVSIFLVLATPALQRYEKERSLAGR